MKPKLKLIGTDGNAFSVLGLAKKAAKKAGWSEDRIDQYFGEATAGDYTTLLAVTSKYFDIS